MPISYVIDNTSGTLSFKINQGVTDGAKGTQHNTSLTLHGYGVLGWGEAVNEDLLKLSENFRVLAKSLGDYNPESELYDYNPATHPLLPKDQNDTRVLAGSPPSVVMYAGGVGAGINNPLEGQTWFNETAQALYVYTKTGWDVIGDTDVTGKVNQSGDTMTGFLTLNANPVNPLHAATKQYADSIALAAANNRLLRSGDTMGIGANLVMNGGQFLGLPAVPTSIGAAASKKYVDDQILVAPYVKLAGDTMTGALKIQGTDGNARLDLISTAPSKNPVLRIYQGSPLAGAPVIEMYNIDNDSTSPLTNAGTWGYTRVSNRDGTILTIEADLDGSALNGAQGPNAHIVTTILQDGRFIHNGIPGISPGVFIAPNCTTALINSNSKSLITREFLVDYVLLTSTTPAAPAAPQYIPAITVYNGAAATDWVTVDADSYAAIPNGASYVMVDVQLETYSNATRGVQIKKWGDPDTKAYTIAYASSQDDDPFGVDGGQGMCQLDANGRFQFRLGIITDYVPFQLGGNTSMLLRMIGYQL
jgi:hypothetical protein